MYYQIDMIYISLSPHPPHHPKLASLADHKDLVLVFVVVALVDKSAVLVAVARMMECRYPTAVGLTPRRTIDTGYCLPD